LKQHPLRHVRRAGVDGARRPYVVEIFEGNHLQLTVNPRVRKRVIIPGLEGFACRVGIVHAQWQENIPLNEFIPGNSRDRGNDLACRHVEQIVIGVFTAKTGRRPHEAQLVDDFVAGVSGFRPEQQIPFAQSHSATVGQKIANGHLVRDIRVIHHETGQTLINGIFPRELARIHQHRQGGGSKCFGVRSDAEHGVFVDRCGIAELSHAETLVHENLSILHNGGRNVGGKIGWRRRARGLRLDRAGERKSTEDT
jgi:hypothetical protein